MRASHHHRRTWELIPWYVNDTLDPAERDRVETHLATCAACRAEVELCEKLVAAGGRPEDLAPAPHPAQIDRLVERIAAEEPESAAPGRVVGPSRLSRPVYRLAAAIVILAAGAAGYLLGSAPLAGPRIDRPAEYRTLSRPDEAAAVTPDAPTLRVVFAPETPEREMRRILLDVGGEILGGPSRLGAYTVRPGVVEEGADPLTVVIHHLRSQPEVLLVEPVPGGAPGEPQEEKR